MGLLECLRTARAPFASVSIPAHRGRRKSGSGFMEPWFVAPPLVASQAGTPWLVWMQHPLAG